MNDPHVKYLIYKLKLDKNISFDKPPALKEVYQVFEITLENDLLTVEMRDHFAEEAKARRVVDPFIKCWELDIALTQGRREVQFEFVTAEIIDRNPSTPGQSQTIEAGAGMIAITGFEAIVQVTRKNYPRPPRQLSYTPDVESLWKRYEGYLDGREPLMSMAYFCLSLLQSSTKGRANAASIYKVDPQVLDKLGELTSERGDKSEARKLDRSSTLTPLTGPEISWIQEALKTLIRRKSEFDFDPNANLSLITLSSLPTI